MRAVRLFNIPLRTKGPVPGVSEPRITFRAICRRCDDQKNLGMPFCNPGLYRVDICREPLLGYGLKD